MNVRLDILYAEVFKRLSLSFFSVNGWLSQMASSASNLPGLLNVSGGIFCLFVCLLFVIFIYYLYRLLLITYIYEAIADILRH